MAIRTRAEARKAALATTSNIRGQCQKVTRGWFNAPSAGDQDNDKDADAVDGWISEPKSKRHSGDRNPPIGVPLAFGGGSLGYGHRAMTVSRNGIRSTDMFDNKYRAGVTSTVAGRTMSDAIAIIEQQMGVKYLGWSSTIDGYPIPDPEAKVKNTSRGKRIDEAIDETRTLVKKLGNAHKSTKNELRQAAISSALKSANTTLTRLKKVSFIK